MGFVLVGLLTKPIDKTHCFVSGTDRPGHRSKGDKDT